MHPAQRLYHLQETDLGLAVVEKRLALVAASLGETEEVQSARQEVAATEDKLQACQTTLRAGELEVKGLSDKIRESEDQLYGGRVSNPKELKGLQEELGSLQRRKKAAEDAQLEAMMELEQLQESLAAQQESLALRLSEWRSQQDGLQREQAELLRQHDRLQAQRSELAAASGAHLRVYEGLRGRRSGRAVALLRGGVCEACGMELPTGEAQQAQRSEGLSFCSSCGRVLWAG